MLLLRSSPLWHKWRDVVDEEPATEIRGHPNIPGLQRGFEDEDDVEDENDWFYDRGSRNTACISDTTR